MKKVKPPKVATEPKARQLKDALHKPKIVVDAASSASDVQSRPSLMDDEETKTHEATQMPMELAPKFKPARIEAEPDEIPLD